MKICPFCAEKIKKEAIKCKHCGEFLDSPADGNAPSGNCQDCGEPLSGDSQFCDSCGILLDNADDV